MITKSTFYYKTKLSSLFKNIHITKRSIHATCWSTLSYSQGTYVTMPLKVTITKRFGGTEKFTKCVGEKCKEALQALTTVNPNNTSTTSPAPTAPVKNDYSPNTTLPLKNLIKVEEAPTSVPSISQTTSQDVLQDDVKRMVRDSYNTNNDCSQPSFQDTIKDYMEKNSLVSENTPANRDVVVGEVNRILTSKNQTMANPTVQEEHQTSPSSGGRVSLPQSNSGISGTQSSRSRTTLNTENSQSVPHTTTRGYASVHGGKYKFPPDPIIASNDSLPKAEGDQSGYHKVVVVSVCNKPECATTNCATETNLNTGDTQPNPCGEPKEYHQRPPEDHEYIVHELGGTLTHTVPTNMTGVRIDNSVDMKGDGTHQDLAVEKGTRPIDPDKFKQNEDLTLYLQTDSHTNVILNNMPPDSVLNEK